MVELRDKKAVSFDIYESDIMIILIGTFGHDRQWLWITTDPLTERISSVQMDDKRLSDVLVKEFGMRKRHEDDIEDVVSLLNELVPWGGQTFKIDTHDNIDS